MVYVALLRGINVGGKNKVGMGQLKNTFVRAGMTNVATYINSGNVIFTHVPKKPHELASKLEAAIRKDFGLDIKVLIRNIDTIRNIVQALPAIWQNDDTMKCDIMFLWDGHDNAEVLNELTIKPDIDEIKYEAGAIIWCVSRENIAKSGMARLASTPLYKQLTIRNCNTVRKLYTLMTAVK